MNPINFGLRDELIVSSISGFLRTTSMQLAGYTVTDFTWWENWWIFTVSSIIGTLVYIFAKWLLRRWSRGETGYSERAEDDKVGSDDAEALDDGEKCKGLDRLSPA
ncbi:hypothetical protein BDW02DRAFT_564670 [Decorospora gaudefroyi]|uniref:Uncharacterized protein n=1 Tax=Decorospora gaudefroyi TaxID=184978 RepID=A0A6A5KTS2_9PLEO|nr:hypothetical protein BDW02DRAFT_564670 [Decorospora gaudefroyi]